MRREILLAGGGWIADDWRVVSAPGDAAPATHDLLPLPSYLQLADAQRAGVGVWLAPADEPAALAAYLAVLPLIAVDFPTFRDGRGYSTAVLLRRHGFRGDLRAIGDVLVDQLFYLRRVGFSSFLLRADQERAAAQAALQTFSAAYQASVDPPLPHFRRRAAVRGAGA